MDFFGLGNTQEMETPLGMLVKGATDPLLLGPDWAKNLEICDSISSFPEAAEAIKAIFHQLKSSDPKVVSLSLTLADTCVQNSWTHIPAAINKAFMDELVSVCRGRKGFHNQEEALRLIQVWGRRFERKKAELPLFFDTYMSLRSQGVTFPPEDDQQEGAAQSQAPPASQKESPSEVLDVNAKITSDLNTVLEQVRLCRQMLPESPGIGSDDLLAEVIGFLEASQGRVLELLEAGFGDGGGLSEEVLEECLRVNDALARTLEAERDGTSIAVEDESTLPLGSSLSTTSGKQSSGLTSSLLEEDVDEFATLTMKTTGKKAKKAGSGGKVPAIKGPGGGGGGGAKNKSSLLIPPPAPAPAAVAVPPQSHQQVDLDFLGGGSTSLPPPPQQQQPAAMAVTQSNNPFDTPGPPQQQQQIHQQVQQSSASSDVLDMFSPPATSAGAGSQAQMTDAEFEQFLNSPPSK